MIDYYLANQFHPCPTPYLHCGSLHQVRKRSQHVFWIAISFLQFNFINHNVSVLTCNLGLVVRALRFISEILPVPIQTARFCLSGLSVLNLFISSEAKSTLSSRLGGLPPRGENLLLLKLLSGLLHSNVERSSSALDERSFANLQALYAGCKWACNSIVNGQQ